MAYPPDLIFQLLYHIFIKKITLSALTLEEENAQRW
jgi:hypothetical protein